MWADSSVRQLFGAKSFDLVKVMGKPVALHPVVEAEICFETRIDQIRHTQRPESQSTGWMMGKREGSLLRLRTAGDVRRRYALHKERQIRQPFYGEPIVISIEGIGRLMRPRGIIILRGFHMRYLGIIIKPLWQSQIVLKSPSER